MSKKHILLAITNGIWLINEGAIEGFSAQIADLLKGTVSGDPSSASASFWANIDKSDPKFLLENKLMLISADRTPYYAKDLSFSNASANSVLIVSMDGPLMKHDNCGDPGAKTYENILKAAKQNPNITAVVMDMDGPGGTVDGTESLANTFGSLGKPVVTFTDGMICSAHYWLAANTNFIIAAANTCQVGSIGVASSFADYSEMWAKLGVKEHYVVADGSEDKNKAYMDARQGKYEAYKKEILNPLRSQFAAAVEKNRGSKLKLSKENVLSGKVYIASDAVENGLIDGVGTLEDAIDKAFELASQAPENNTNQSKINMKKITLMVAAHAALIALCGVKAEAGKDSVDIEMSEDTLGRINAALVAGATAASDLTAANTALAAEKEKVTTAENKATDAEAKSSKAEQDLADYKVSNPGSTTTPQKGADKLDESGESEFSQELANDMASTYDKVHGKGAWAAALESQKK